MPKRPNVLVITTHDSGRHFGCYGIPTVRTPNIDALARDGVKFTRMFATSSICSPSRGSLLTGQYPQRNGLIGLAGGCWRWEMHDPTRHLSHVMQRAGYRTALFGIQHETSQPGRMGWQQHDPYLPAAEPGAPKDAVRVAQGFAEFIRREGAEDRPFYAQMGFFETHTDYLRGPVEPDDGEGVHIPAYAEEKLGQARDGMAHPGDEALRDHLAAFQGSVRHADRAVGIAMEALREAGLEENTLVLYNTDHGVELPRAKWTMYDPGIGVAFILRWPGGDLTGGRTCDRMLSNVDFLPTLSELIDLPVEHDMDGVSFASALERGSEGNGPREAVFSLFVNAELYAARTERYKLIRNFKEMYEPAPEGGRRWAVPTKLFDLEQDPLELNDLSDDPACAGVLEEMNGRLWDWLERVDAPILRGRVRTPYYEMSIADYRRRRKDAPGEHSG